VRSAVLTARKIILYFLAFNRTETEMKKTTKPATVKSAVKKAPAPAKKPVAKKAEPKVVPAKKQEPKVAAKKAVAKKSAAKKTTRIVARIDIGWGNMLFVRGEGAGLSWEQGVPMLCTEKDGVVEWYWTAETADGPISFKFLINDETWATGENVTINAGDTHISKPSF